ncbi:sugar phosphate isomerase/epimerase [Mangrovimicrobium sediminis]|uniref:Sugar phosphate isomerase/epimerase n=1 Tax=Mangrovimicrobium sediminis TaxID=2562682 RepID=A0A4Z0LZI7_9GAMM|nr:sugar phosphate isomerase/epimerase family protein [Haliea sp. SAOS-164]TGD72681.1 sugar phosphate isomerase/epimerase [Haliea sp. SAOS-164]
MHDRISVDSIAFMRDSLDTQAGYWRELGAGRLTLLGAHIAMAGTDAVAAVLADGGYRLESIVHPFLTQQSLDRDPATWEAPRASMNAEIDAAAALGARSIYMVTGGHGDMSWEQAAEVFRQAIAPCVAKARDAGVELLIENAPPGYADIHIAHSLRDTVQLAEFAEVGVCIDLPGCWTEAGLRETFVRAMPRCHLVQVSDYVYGDRCVPARAVPGDGDMPLRRLFEWLLEAGYTGAFDMELIGPRIDEEGGFAATRRSALYMDKLLTQIGA